MHDVINGLSNLIRLELHRSSEESHRPSLGIDASGYLLCVTNARVKELRRIREELENILTASTTENP